ncbi:MAG TPA: hypothetical protein DHW34_02985 [Actinobacteria bacterium]|nr:hypothetical protein [Actinomycetota bacterium]HCK78963.1 hypothetical protein [Actinomycetota bacterium]
MEQQPVGYGDARRQRLRRIRRRRLTTTVTVLVAVVVLLGWSVQNRTSTSPASSTRSATNPSSTTDSTTVPSTPSATRSSRPAVSASTSAGPIAVAPAPTTVPKVTTTSGAVPIVRRINTTDPVVFLTIDDGYDRDPAFRDYIVARNIPLTMFLVSQAANADPQFFSTLSQVNGSSIQNHSVTHANFKAISSQEQKQQICGNSAKERSLFGSTPTFLRPPYGNLTTQTPAIAKSCGIRAIVLWSVSMPSYKIYYQSGNRLQRGDIILLHFRDHGGVKNMNSLLNTISAQGLRVASLTDYLKP